MMAVRPKAVKPKLPMIPTHRIANPKNVAEWENTLRSATDFQIRKWLRSNWSLWRRDMLLSMAYERGLI